MLGNGLRLSLLGRGHFPAGRRRTPRPAGRPPLRPRACRVASPRWRPPRRSPCSPTRSGLSRKPLTFPWFSSPREPVPSVTDWPVSRRPPSCVSVPAWPRMTPANAHSDSLNNLSTSWCPGARGRSGAASQAPRPRAPADRTPPSPQCSARPHPSHPPPHPHPCGSGHRGTRRLGSSSCSAGSFSVASTLDFSRFLDGGVPQGPSTALLSVPRRHVGV